MSLLLRNLDEQLVHSTFIVCFVPGVFKAERTGERGEAGTHYSSQWSGRRLGLCGDCLSMQNVDEVFLSFWVLFFVFCWMTLVVDGVFLFCCCFVCLFWFLTFEVCSISQRRKQSRRKI